MHEPEKLNRWLSARGITLEEGFVPALRRLAKSYAKANGISVEEAYRRTGARKQYVSYWSKHPFEGHTKKLKHQVIKSAGLVFGLTPEETEDLANRAGLSLVYDPSGFHEYFRTILQSWRGTYRALCETAQMSERMFRRFRTDLLPPKQVLTALGFALGLSVEGTRELLRHAGYILSKSLPNDAVVLMYLGKRAAQNTSLLLMEINDALFEFGLPLLLPRDALV